MQTIIADHSCLEWDLQADLLHIQDSVLLHLQTAQLILSPLVQDKVHVWRMRRFWQAWLRGIGQQQKAIMLADKAGMHERLQQWHQKLMETGEEVRSSPELASLVSMALAAWLLSLCDFIPEIA